jgi:hypothetical protein
MRLRLPMLAALIGLLALISPLALRASPVSYAGSFLTDDQVDLFTFQVDTAGTVTLQTFGYAGGVDGAGVTVAAGGFDPVLTLFEGSGNFLETNDDGACGVVGTDPTTLNCFDAYLSLPLGVGDYTLALTEADNLPLGDLVDGFSQVGNGNFSCPEFLGQTGAFCDASPSQRDGQYEVDIDAPALSPSPAPEPASGVLLLTAAVVAACLRVDRWKLRVQDAR